jgi:hypothetical protein
MNFDQCIFCGIDLPNNSMHKRCKLTEHVVCYVIKYCEPTEYFYKFILSLKKEDITGKSGDKMDIDDELERELEREMDVEEEKNIKEEGNVVEEKNSKESVDVNNSSPRLAICIPCVNWQRRGTKGRKKAKAGKKQYLLMDQFILFMLEPGKYPFPDQRCCTRLVSSLKAPRPASWLISIMPLPVLVMLEGVSANVKRGDLLNSLMKVWWDYNDQCVFFAHSVTAKLVRKMLKYSASHQKMASGVDPVLLDSTM